MKPNRNINGFEDAFGMTMGYHPRKQTNTNKVHAQKYVSKKKRKKHPIAWG
jgi:hypothetical protein